tara:strand:- start:109 stop:5988 length:5880 start_codon:yes stop_codon:yes gene_type:complete
MKIAIIGINVKLPNSINSLDDIYNKLSNKEDCVDNIPKDRYNINKYYDSDNDVGKFRTKRGGFIKNIYDFDNTFFNIGNKEAKSTDPQQRLLLMSVYETLQDANIKRKDFEGTNTGVFIGSCSTEYFSNIMEKSEYCNEYCITGGLMTLMSNRISYVYNLKGPSMTIDTACSSSGNSLHMAVESLKRGETEMCIVGGSNLLINPETTVCFSQGNFLSPDGKCKTFDNSANGYVRSEGIVTILIKPLEKAIIDNNHIHAVILSTGSNQDGHTKSITMPNGKMQENLLKKCYQNINLDEIVYIEAHGTGTKLGDKIEANSIGNIIGKNRKNKLNIGSIKCNIGHTEATSGLAGIAKIITMMRYRELLPNIHFDNPSEDIDIEELNLNIVTENVKITTDKIIMGVNNYGFGGANFHCVLENYSQGEFNNKKLEDISDIKCNLHLLCCYGADKDSIDKNVYKFLEYEDNFLSYLNSSNNSEKLDEAKIFIVNDKENFEEVLFNPLEKELSMVYGKFSNSNPKIAFVFGGQGSQYEKMGIELMKDFPIFSETIHRCDSIWNQLTGFSFIEKYGVFTEEIVTPELFNDPIIAQPAILFFQIAMVELLKFFNVTAHTIVGHSAGELGAFYASGGISLKDIIRVSYYRSIDQQKTVGTGNMLVINDDINKINEYLDKYNNLELAVINSSKSFVLAGKKDELLELKDNLSEQTSNISAIMIKGRCPFHSSKQDIIREEILKNTSNIKFSQPKIELLSTVTGTNFVYSDYSDDYWWKNIRETVQFNDTIEYNCDVDIFIEISPHPVLSYYLKNETKSTLVLPTSNRKENSSRRFLSSLAKLYFSGVKININNFGTIDKRVKHINQWNMKKFRHIPIVALNRKLGIDCKYNEFLIEYDNEPYLRDHIVGNNVIIPTVKYIDLIRKFIIKDDEIIKNFKINNMFVIKKEEKYATFNLLYKDNKFILFNDNVNYVEFNIVKKSDNNNKLEIDIDNIIANGNVSTKKQNIKILNNKGFNFGDNMYNHINSYTYNNIIVTEYSKTTYHPTMIDISLTNVMFHQGLSNNLLYLPTSISEINFIKKISSCQKTYVVNIIKELNRYGGLSDGYVVNHNHEILVQFKNMFYKNVSNYTADLYRIDHIDNLSNCDIASNSYEVININSNDNSYLLKIRDILMLNQEKNYIIVINNNYDIIGFTRVLINEISNVKFKVCFFMDNYKETNKYIINFNNIEGFFHDGSYLERLSLVGDLKLKNLSKYNYYLHYDIKGSINNMKIKLKKYDELCNNQVKIKVNHSSINFKDLAVILGIVNDINIGYELSGTVVESKSVKFKVGDMVFCTNPNKGCGFTNYFVTDEKFVWKQPDTFTDVMSASMGLSYGTAYLALIHFGRITNDDLIVIHSASGALGLACLELCKYIGCKVIATCSTEVKKKYLLDNYSNIVLVTNSRDNEQYYNDIMEFTQNNGVDIVLGSSYDKFIESNMNLLRSGGKYLDVGKRQLLENKPIPSKYFLNSISYIGVHFDRLLESDNSMVRDCINKVIELFNDNKIELFKYTEKNFSDYIEVFKSFSKSEHIGKVVLKMDDININDYLLPDIFLDSSKYYLITGGFGGLGIKMIDFLINNGANKIIITTRKAKDNIFKDLKQKYQNVEFKMIVDDIMNKDILEDKLKNFDIDGIFHLAGNIKDMFVNELNIDDLNQVINIKKRGLINLGEIFEDKEHTYFIAFSSIVSIIGNIGQANYAAANSFMDYYCNDRNKKGLPGLSINLGAIGGCGMIEKDNMLAEIMISKGIDFLHYYYLFDNLKYIMICNNKYSNLLITNQDFTKLDFLNNKTIISNLTNEKRIKEKTDNVSDKLIEYVEKLVDVDSIDIHKNLLSYGVDSLMSIEIANFCKNKLNIMINQVDILQGITIKEIIIKHDPELMNEIIDENNDKFYFVSKNEVNFEITDNDFSDKSNYLIYLICILLFLCLLFYYYY